MAGRAGQRWRAARLRSCKRFAAPARIRGVDHGEESRRGLASSDTTEGGTGGEQGRGWWRRGGLYVVAAVLGVLVTPTAAQPVHASVTNTAVCIGWMDLSFSPGFLNAVPASKVFTVSGGGTCSGLGSGPISWSTGASGITGILVSCADMLATGTGTVTFQSVTTNVNIVLAGSTAAVTLAMADNSGNNALQASGVFAWDTPSEITACLTTSSTSGTQTVSLRGALVVVT